jgi:hypothetical protein
MNTRTRRPLLVIVGLIVVSSLCGGCGSDADTSESESDPVRTSLETLQRIDSYPIYVMHWTGSTSEIAAATMRDGAQSASPNWACSLFAALGDPDNAVFGRNFDWEHSPMLLLYTNPDDGYISVTSVDLAYLIEDASLWPQLDTLPIDDLLPLAGALSLPFNGMNEHGLAVAMASVPTGSYPLDPEREEVGHLEMMRRILEGARTTDEAVAMIETMSLSNQGGPPLHYLIADRETAVVLEFVDGRSIVHRSADAWHCATNFTLALAETWDGVCPRFDALTQRLSGSAGTLTPDTAMDLLQDVSNEMTQWSIVYDLSRCEVHIATARAYEAVHSFSLTRTGLISK